MQSLRNVAAVCQHTVFQRLGVSASYLDSLLDALVRVRHGGRRAWCVVDRGKAVAGAREMLGWRGRARA